MTRLEIGDEAPQFVLPTLGGNEVSLAGLLARAEKGVVVYFYPKASTPGCTTQACDFRDSLAAWRAAGYEVVGISPDKIPALERFTEKKSLTFPLAADPEKTVLTAYGTWGEKKNYGRIFQGVIRSTFVVGKDGKIVLAKYNVKATGHVERLRKELGIDA